MRRGAFPVTLIAMMLLLANAASTQTEPKLIIDILTVDGRPLEIQWVLEGQGLRFEGTSSKVVIDDLPDGSYLLIIHLPHLGIGMGMGVEVRGLTRMGAIFPVADVILVFMLDGVEPIRNANVRLVAEGGAAVEATTNQMGEALFEKLLMGHTYKLELRWNGRLYEKVMKIEETRLVINVPSGEVGAPKEAPPGAQRTVTVTATVTTLEALVWRISETVIVETTETIREVVTRTVTATAVVTTTSFVEREIIPGIPLMIGIIAGAAIIAAAIIAAARKRAKAAQYYEGYEEYYGYEGYYEEERYK